jgi:hypothetical protein
MRLFILCLLFISSASYAQFPCGEPPPFTAEELTALRGWSGGGAFRVFAKYAGAEFDFPSYRRDCPNWAAFGYGLHNGPQCTMGIDVANAFDSLIWVMSQKRARDPEHFSEYYWAEAEKLGFLKYLSRTPASHDRPFGAESVFR